MTPPTSPVKLGSGKALRVRIQFGIPKLLAKVHPDAAAAIPAKNLCQVILRKAQAKCSQVAVLHVSTGVAVGEVLVSPLLARLLDVEEKDAVELETMGQGKDGGVSAVHTPTHARQCLMQELPRDLGTEHCFQVQLDKALRKLMVQLHPTDARRLAIQNHEEVMLFNAASQCGHFAMAQTNHHVYEGELSMAPFMAGLLDVSRNDTVHVVPTAAYMQDERAAAIKRARAKAAAVAVGGSIADSGDNTTGGPTPPGQSRRAATSSMIKETKESTARLLSFQDAGEKAPVASTPTAEAVAAAPRPFRRFRSSPTLPKAEGSEGVAIVLHRASSSWSGRASSKRASLGRTLGSLQLADLPSSPARSRHNPVPRSWQPPAENAFHKVRLDTELSKDCREVAIEVQKWFAGDTSGMRCAHILVDRAVTILASYKGVDSSVVDVLGGPLGAIIGGYNHADWLYEDFFKLPVKDAVQRAFEILSLKATEAGDWSNLSTQDVAVAHTRLSLQNQPSRGGDARTFLMILVSVELVNAFIRNRSEEGDQQDAPSTRFTDEVLGELLKQSSDTAAASCSQQELEATNRALDEYLLRLMTFKSEIVSDVGRLHENCAYAVLGVTSEASDAEIKRAYRLSAMQCHPDKGGNKAQFQELASAYEKIMRQRFGNGADEQSEPVPAGPSKPPKPPSPKKPQKTWPPTVSDPSTVPSDGMPRSFTPPDVSAPPKAKTASQQAADAAFAAETDASLAERASENIVDKAKAAAEQADQYTKNAADYASKASNSAKAAYAAAENGATGADLKPLAQSAIVLTLAAVKAVRLVAYAALEVASQCRHMSRHMPSATKCLEHNVTATSSGQEVLNVALASAILVEAIAKELKSAEAEEAEQGTSVSLRFANAASNAALAAENAAKAAKTASASAAAGSKVCAEAFKMKPAAAKEATSKARGSSKSQTSQSEACERLLKQRRTSLKLLRRLNGEILGYQHDVQRLQLVNQAILPEVHIEQKALVFNLLKEFLDDARKELEEVKATSSFSLTVLVTSLQKQPMFAALLQDPPIAIPVSIEARTLRMANLYDMKLATKLLEDELLILVREAIKVTDDGTGSMSLVNKSILDDFVEGVLGALKADAC